ncbi:MAG: energy transducer TonB [Bacteroidales bacterium]|jgi:protein TonB
MVSKKTRKANLEKRKPLFFEIGLTIAIALAIAAFELSPSEKPPVIDLSYLDEFIPEELEIDITRVEKKKQLEKPKAIQFEIVENTVDIPEPDFDLDMDIDPWDLVYYLPDLPDEPPEDDDIFVAAEEMPQYRNGDLMYFHNFIQSIVKYPPAAIELGLEGTVYVTFVVNKKGKITGIKILRGIDPLLDNEVIAAIERSERWKPGKQSGRPVNVAMSMPVTFKIQ